MGLVYLLTELLADQVVGVPLVLQELMVAQVLQGKVMVGGLGAHQIHITAAEAAVALEAGVVAQVHL